MTNIVATEAANVLGANVAGLGYSAPVTPINLALMTANGTDLTLGTEVTGGSYARQSTSAIWGAPSASSESITNSAGSVSFTSMPGPITITGIELWDSYAGRTFTTGVTTSSSATLTASSGAFTAADVGRILTGTDIPAGAFILSVTSGTSVVMSAAASTGASTLSVTVGPKRVWWGALSASKTVNSGDTVTFATSSLVLQIS